MFAVHFMNENYFNINLGIDNNIMIQVVNEYTLIIEKDVFRHW